ncbi:hypothetical protein Dsin_014082 [Dipteronia sinensis]|uniref:F-box domain-containing protein n=1 Tax=Dipteronia sinensis TaxID=43782 RepID=A0AAE0ALJ6_9ROSI|nr:hypothetical protein Dsin_014082 [Dipteronia sinensis]
MVTAIEIETPNLGKITFVGRNVINFSFNGLALSEANICIGNYNNVYDNDWYVQYIQLLEKFGHSKVLNIRSSTDQDVIIPGAVRQIRASPLFGVKHVNFISSRPYMGSVISKILDGLLWIAPHVETISIELDNSNKSYFKFSYKNKIDCCARETATCYKSFPVSCWQHCIKEVEIENTKILEKGFSIAYCSNEGNIIERYVLRDKEIMEKISNLKGSFDIMKKIKVEEVDWISGLPDSILHHIFLFLPFQQVVQTCVLSKRWEELWLSYPVLEFDRSLFDGGLRDPWLSNNYNMETNKEYKWRAKELFSVLVRNLRERRKGKETMFPLKKFALEMDFFNDFELKSLLDRCISYAIECKVKELKLIFNCSSTHLWYNPHEVIFSAKLIQVLELKGWKLDLPTISKAKLTSLRKLILIGVFAGDYMMKNLVDGCPLIETLSFSACSGFKSIDASGLSKLNEVKLTNNHQLGKVAIKESHVLVELRIDSPNLHIFVYQGGIVSFSLNALALSKFSLHLCCPRVKTQWYVYECFFEPTQWYIKYVEFLAKLNDFSDVLQLQFEIGENAIVPPELRQVLSSPLPSLKHLKLRLDVLPMCWSITKLADGLLWLAPHTLNVSIRYGALDESTFKLSFSYKKEGETATCCKSFPISCWQHCIEEVNLEITDEYYQGKKNSKTYILKGVDIRKQIDALCGVAVL